MKYQARNNYLINWPEYPLLRISVCFIIGIILSDNCSIPMNFNILFLVGLFILYTIVGNYWKHSRVVISILSCSILLIGILLGLFRGNLQKSSNNSFHYNKYIQDENVLVGRIASELKKKKRYTTTLEVLEINGRNSEGKLLLYFSNRDSIIDYQKGDIIYCEGKIQSLQDNSNPRSFNYKDHLKYKGVGAQIFLKEGSHNLVGEGGLNPLVSRAFKIRNWALSIFEDRLKNKDHLATASAMVLGYREHLSEDLYNSFSETGAVHVLAVSGLHVGIICMLFIMFFNRFKSEHVLFKIIKLSTLLSAVWLYALITGASPAVLRAAVMFSLILIGRLWFKGVNVYNILAFSALIILIYDPFLLFQLSFQFSYLALISIIFFQPKIERLYETKHWISTKIWQLTSVSIAAQFLIFPISIFYFHKFPTYFILSGVVAVFLATFILGLGLVLLCLDNVPFIGDFIATIYSGLLDVFINTIAGIQSLPFNNIQDVYISESSVILLYVLICTLMFILSLQPRTYKDVINKKVIRKRVAKGILALCTILLLCNNLIFDIRVKTHQELIIYDISKATAIDIFCGHHSFSLHSDGIDIKKLDYASKSYRIYNGNPDNVEIQKEQPFSFGDIHYDGNGMLLYNNKLILLAKEFKNEMKIPCFSDILLVTHCTDILPDIFLGYHSPKQVVLDNSIDFRLKQKWEKACLERRIPIHDIYKDGVFRLKDSPMYR